MTTNPKLSAIVAMDQNNVIGRNGDLPWRLPSDLKHFKIVTMGKPCLMGRKTWESLPFPLPGRPNLVLTRDQSYSAPKAEVFHEPKSFIGKGFEYAGLLGQDEVMLIGGAQLYKVFLPYCDRLYVSHIETEVDGDAKFPEIDPEIWRQTTRNRQSQGPKDEFAFSIAVYDRIF